MKQYKFCHFEVVGIDGFFKVDSFTCCLAIFINISVNISTPNTNNKEGMDIESKVLPMVDEDNPC